MKNEYLTSYQHLEIAPGCTWLEVRRAYKRLVKKWHPDHFHNDARAQSLANEKIKEINCAFDVLSVHYRTHGVLPLIVKTFESPVAYSHPYSNYNAPQSQSTVATQSDAPSAHSNHRSHTTKQKNRSQMFIRVALMSLAVWLGYALWQAPRGPKDRTSMSDAAHLNTTTGADSASTAQAQAQPNTNYFTFGSTVGEVYAVQGTPTKAIDSVWHYGKSKIYFSGGKVIRWEEDTNNPLRAKADKIRPTPTQAVANTFSVGSTKAEVRAVQGKPLMEWNGMWEYGLSKVYFDGDRVRSWYDSPLNPLMIPK